METSCKIPKKKSFLCIVVTILAILISGALVVCLTHNNSTFNPIDPKLNENEVYAYFYLITAAATAALATIAYSQLSSVNNELEANFFLDLERLWMLESHAEARFLICELLLECEKEKNGSTLVSKLNGLKKSSLMSDRKKHRTIIDFINLLELMGYYHYKKQVSAKEFNLLYGDILVDYGKLLISDSGNIDGFTSETLEHFGSLTKEIEEIKNTIKKIRKKGDEKTNKKIYTFNQR